jgi:hypothetical protein
MSHRGAERRRMPRVVPSETCHLRLETSTPVQVLDISQAGLQLSSKFVLATGEQAGFRTTIGKQEVRLPIEIRRVAIETNPARGSAQYRAGAVFGPMTVEQRVFLKQVLGAEPT